MELFIDDPRPTPSPPDPGPLKCVWIPGVDGGLECIWVPDWERDLQAAAAQEPPRAASAA